MAGTGVEFMKRPGASRLGRWALGLVGALALTGCKSSNLLSTKQEVQIGQQAAAQISRQYRVDTTSADAQRVRRIGDRLLIHSDQRAGVPYSFSVLDTKDINAVSLPGGPIYVYRGLLDLVGDDNDALACVIGHELGHINARHAAKQISQQMEANAAISLLLKGQTVQNIAGLADQLLTLQYSRADEYEADKRGLSYAYKAGFDPHGLLRFFRKLQAIEGSGGTPQFLRDHPLTKDRITRAEKIIETQDYPYGQ